MVRIFERYLADIGRERLLTAEEEARLARATRAGDPVARSRLVSANLRFVVSVARSYQGRGLPLPDLVNEGNLGLVRAADRFDPGRGVRFISYAQFWVRRAMTQAIAVHQERASADGAAPRRVSLDDRPPGAMSPFSELLPDTRAPAPEDRLVREDLRDVLEASLADLPDRERAVVRDYFGLGVERARSLSDIACDMGVSRERVRQLKDQALARLRASSWRHDLAGFSTRTRVRPRTGRDPLRRAERDRRRTD